jgi:hypothetical protein
MYKLKKKLSNLASMQRSGTSPGDLMNLTLGSRFVSDTTQVVPPLMVLQAVNKSFGSMESRIGQMGKSAVRIGMLPF